MKADIHSNFWVTCKPILCHFRQLALQLFLLGDIQVIVILTHFLSKPVLLILEELVFNSVHHLNFSEQACYQICLEGSGLGKNSGNSLVWTSFSTQYCFNTLVLNAVYYALKGNSTLSFPEYLKYSQIQERIKSLSQRDLSSWVEKGKIAYTV